MRRIRQCGRIGIPNGWPRSGAVYDRRRGVWQQVQGKIQHEIFRFYQWQPSK